MEQESLGHPYSFLEFEIDSLAYEDATHELLLNVYAESTENH